MRLSFVLSALVCTCVVVIGVAAPAVQDQEDVRGAFLTSRPKEKPVASETTSRRSRRRPKPVVAKPSEDKPGTPPDSTGPSTTTTAKPVNVPRIGLGLTLFSRDSNGLAIRTDPERVFRKGDRVRIVLETNADGYLYIFNTTNDGPPIMIYPDAELDEAGNYLQAHVPFEVPSSASTEERLRWLAFDDVPGTERLFFVFTREPLNGVPIEDELITFCRSSSVACPWRPATEIWEHIQKQMQEPLATDKTHRYGRAQTEPEQQATTRGISLAKEDPPPSLIMMASSKAPLLVATLDLIHK